MLQVAFFIHPKSSLHFFCYRILKTPLVLAIMISFLPLIYIYLNC